MKAIFPQGIINFMGPSFGTIEGLSGILYQVTDFMKSIYLIPGFSFWALYQWSLWIMVAVGLYMAFISAMSNSGSAE